MHPEHPVHPVPTDEMGAAWADIHLRLSACDFAEISLLRWSDFLDGWQSDSTRILESFPFQSAIRVLVQLNASEEAIQNYWLGWQAIVSNVDAHLVYLQSKDSTAQMNRIAERRGPEWSTYLADAVAQMPIAVRDGFRGWTGVLEFIERYHQIMESLVSSSSIQILMFEAEPENYASRLQQVLGAVAASSSESIDRSTV